MPIQLPETFLWTRIGPEGGFSLPQIIYWKEIQRAVGNGTFWWGIGTAPAKEKVRVAIGEKCPTVLFSVQKTQKHRGRGSRSRILWTKYVDENGRERGLEENVYITSESLTGRSHHAIKAQSLKPLETKKGIGFDLGLFQHYHGKKRIGQAVTSVLQRDLNGVVSGEIYDEGFQATLLGIYELTGPKKLNEGTFRELDELVCRRPAVSEFVRVMQRVRATI